VRTGTSNLSVKDTRRQTTRITLIPRTHLVRGAQQMTEYICIYIYTDFHIAKAFDFGLHTWDGQPRSV